MALTEEEANQAFRFLADTLREARLGWVVTQVEEKLAVGKVQSKKLREREEPARFEAFWVEGSERVPLSQKSGIGAVRRG